jgi:hypothetical protein
MRRLLLTLVTVIRSIKVPGCESFKVTIGAYCCRNLKSAGCSLIG